MWNTLVYRRNTDHPKAVAALTQCHGLGSVAYREAQHFDGCEATGQVLILDGSPNQKKIIDAYAELRDENGDRTPIEAQILQPIARQPIVSAPEPAKVEHFEPATETFEVEVRERPPLRSVIPRAKLIALQQAGYGSVDSFQKATIGDLIKIQGIGRSTAQKLKAWAKE